jgi:hypothetical protein
MINSPAQRLAEHRFLRPWILALADPQNDPMVWLLGLLFHNLGIGALGT